MENINTLQAAILHFSDYENCKAVLVQLRWPDGVACPRCGATKVTYLANKRVWKCYGRHAQPTFSLKTGTIFEDSPLGLDKWLPALWLAVNSKNGISSCEVARALGVTQKTAWFMMHRIRVALQSQGGELFKGQIEADETFIGGKAKNMQQEKRFRLKMGSGYIDNKVAVLGILQRKQKGSDGHSVVRTKVIPDVTRATLDPEVRKNVRVGSEILTDAHSAYRSLDDNYMHQFVDHIEKYAEGHIHTNGLENFWSLLKRALGGTYVSVEPAHLSRYVDEQVFRYNNRKGKDGDRFTKAAGSIVGKRLTYQDLIGKDAEVHPALA